MDKKELQNLIDRIGLTGPEGIKKAKKALREIVQNSEDIQKKAEEDIQKAQEQVSNDLLDDEYTIAQAVNDLNERIEELQSQIAQQDSLVINVPEGDGLIDVLPQEKATEYVKKGTLLGATVCFEPITGGSPQGSAFGRIIAYEMDATDSRVINLQFAMRDGTTCLEYE